MFAVPGWLSYNGFGYREFVVAEERLQQMSSQHSLVDENGGFDNFKKLLICHLMVPNIDTGINDSQRFFASLHVPFEIY